MRIEFIYIYIYIYIYNIFIYMYASRFFSDGVRGLGSGKRLRKAITKVQKAADRNQIQSDDKKVE